MNGEGMPELGLTLASRMQQSDTGNRVMGRESGPEAMTGIDYEKSTATGAKGPELGCKPSCVYSEAFIRITWLVVSHVDIDG